MSASACAANAGCPVLAAEQSAVISRLTRRYRSLGCSAWLVIVGALSTAAVVPRQLAAAGIEPKPVLRQLSTGLPPALPSSGRRDSILRVPAAWLSGALIAPAAIHSEAAQAAQPITPFNLVLPSSSWKVKKKDIQAIRLRSAKIYEAQDKESGATISVKRSPLGADQSVNGERILELADAFDGKKSGKPISKEEVVKLLTEDFDNPTARRARQIVEVRRLPEIEEFRSPGDRRYVRFGYDSRDCTGKVFPYTRYDGVNYEECDGKVSPWRRHIVCATVLPTRFTSMRSMVEGTEIPLSRLYETLWLFDATAPVSSMTPRLQSDLEESARSFSVPPAGDQDSDFSP